MATISRSVLRVTLLSSIIVSLCIVTLLFRGRHGISRFSLASVDGIASHTLVPTATLRPAGITSLYLTEEQCGASFPGLTQDIDDAISRGTFMLKKEDPDYKGLVQGRIKDGNLYILTVAPDTTKEILWERNAILHQLHRAIVTSPQPLPDTKFALCINDEPRNNSWTFARPHKPTPDLNHWPMPHFSFWSWPLSTIGAMDEALQKIEHVEKEVPWEKKVDKVVWRGTMFFNPVGNPVLRGTLVKAARGREWADVEALRWKDGRMENGLAIEKFCGYRYVIYTEGVTYSGRLPFHQACASVLLTPPLAYLQHTSFLMRPISSRTLLGQSPLPDSGIRKTMLLNTTTNPTEANAVFVAPDWSDLEATVKWLQKHQDIAKGIAERQRERVVKGGYLSQAAEVCYWRALIRGWASVTVVDEGDWDEELGTRWETFVLKGELGKD